MVSRDVFYQRLPVCQACEHWRGVCLKGHPLQSPVGCPIRKFEPVGGAGYHEDRPYAAPVSETGPREGCCGAQQTDDVVPLTWNQALAAFASSMAKFAKEGFKIVDAAEYGKRLGECRSCEEYVHFQCRLCKCVCLAKAKVAHESCPKKKWGVFIS